MSVEVAVLGSVNVDLVVRAPHLPGAGETVLGSGFATHSGGKGANQAVAAARLGARVALIGAVGDDAHGALRREELAADDVDLSGMVVRPGVPTGVALITVDDGGENTIVVSPGANGTLTAADVDAAGHLIEGARVLLAQLEVPIAAVRRGAELARRAGVTVLLNAAPACPLPRDLLALVDVLVVNQGEADVLAARPGAKARNLLEMGPSVVFLTRGGEGATAATRKLGATRPAFAVRAVDAVGAGDAFAGALAVAWAERRRLEEVDEAKLGVMLDFACAAGALAVQREGATSSLPRRAEIEELLGRGS